MVASLFEYAEFSGADYFFRFRLETPFLGKLGPQNQSCQFKVNLIPAIISKIFLDLMFYQVFSPQVKRCAIITYKYRIYVLPHELPNHSRTHLPPR